MIKFISYMRPLYQNVFKMEKKKDKTLGGKNILMEIIYLIKS